jgi:hypothetical protein
MTTWPTGISDDDLVIWQQVNTADRWANAVIPALCREIVRLRKETKAPAGAVGCVHEPMDGPDGKLKFVLRGTFGGPDVEDHVFLCCFKCRCLFMEADK